MPDNAPDPAPDPAMPWRLLILDADPGDAKWLLATIANLSDVRPAVMDAAGRRYQDWPQIVQWVEASLGGRVQLTPITSTCWTVREVREAGNTSRRAGHFGACL
jgi:hypothetical protein